MSRARSVIRNLFSLTFAEGVNRAIGVVIIAFLARRLGPERFGTLTVATSIVSYAAFFTDMGLLMHGIRSIARQPASIGGIIGEVLSARIVLVVGAFLALAAGALAFIDYAVLRALVILTGLTLFSQALSPAWIFQGTQKMQFAAGHSVIQSLGYALFVFLAVRGDGDVAYVPLALLSGGLLANAFFYLPFRKIADTIKLRFSWRSSLKAVSSSAPAGISVFLITNANWNIPLVLLGAMRPGTPDTGYFSAAFKCILVLISVAMAFQIVLFPVITELLAGDREGCVQLFRRLEKIICVFGFPLIAGTFATGKDVITLICGGTYAQSAPLLSILVGSVVFFTLNILYFDLLVAADEKRRNMVARIAHTAILAASTAAGISCCGAAGAAWAYVGSEALVFALHIRMIRPYYHTRIHACAIRPALAAGAMFFVLSFLPGTHVLARAALGTAVYAALIFALKGVSLNDITAVAGMFRRPGKT